MIVLYVGLAAAFLTRLFTRDTITEPIREWFVRHLDGKFEVLATCPWCEEVWFATGLFAVTWTQRSITLPWLSLLVAIQVGRMAFWVTEMMARISEDG